MNQFVLSLIRSFFKQRFKTAHVQLASDVKTNRVDTSTPFVDLAVGLHRIKPKFFSVDCDHKKDSKNVDNKNVVKAPDDQEVAGC